ncbi:hypothetical protein HYH03_015234 [Edaphochlamys debaryana]|uniref:DUF559 domain-containing protein n=1 Tax=Edaphochlamys debaryana TaxID=47281 RepID=A0A836BR29_9CHLO|nr:hypothetical protein HYH03_015234 [Edaphochlamys debaryana]|eukprot:KAG2486026.1 hypothetical protein HYH03_015234 [Edaphochlamys debaryana]
MDQVFTARYQLVNWISQTVEAQIAANAGERRGGYNKLTFTGHPWVYDCFMGESWLLDELGVDSCVRVLWRRPCGCYYYETPHAVKCRIRREEDAAQVAWPWLVFWCPIHARAREWEAPRSRVTASKFALCAHALMCRLSSSFGYLPVVTEARVLTRFGAFDFWAWELKVLVEVDGQHHFYDPEQAARDRRKEQAAVAAGFHVVRLHYGDFGMPGEWQAALVGALEAAGRDEAPAVRRSASYGEVL